MVSIKFYIKILHLLRISSIFFHIWYHREEMVEVQIINVFHVSFIPNRTNSAGFLITIRHEYNFLSDH